MNKRVENLGINEEAPEGLIHFGIAQVEAQFGQAHLEAVPPRNLGRDPGQLTEGRRSQCSIDIVEILHGGYGGERR